ncbi:MAG: AI-2E family transporter [bacterium]
MGATEKFWSMFPWKKVVIWGFLLGVLYVLRNFFTVIFLSFIFSYISLTIVNRLDDLLPKRRWIVVAVFTFYVAILVIGSWTLFPQAYTEGQELYTQFIDQQTGMEKSLQKGKLPYLRGFLEALIGEEQVKSWAETGWYRFTSKQLAHMMAENATKLFEHGFELFKHIFTFALHFLIALIFSFLIVFDYQNLRDMITQLADSRLDEFYVEVAPGIRQFFSLLGRAFEAQAIIALLNTVLTTIGILVMQIPRPAFLAGVVFFCSFIPVFGVIMSSVPIALLALKTGGPILMFIAIGYILIIHGVEAYILNPQIYGVHLELHPLVVLMVLLVGEHFFGVWGLILGVPVFRYLWYQVILAEEPRFEMDL